MGWWKNWRERGSGGAGAEQETPITVHQVLNDLARIRLDAETAHAKASLEEAVALQAERKEIREEKRVDRAKNREARQQSAQHARDVRSGKIPSKRGGESPCVVCARPGSIEITPLDISRHREHAPLN